MTDYSLNVPVPAAVARLADSLAPRLTGFDRVRDRHTLVCKRLGPPVEAADPDLAVARLRERLRGTLADVPPFGARVTGVGRFPAPATGPAPVVYLAVESPALARLHDELCGQFDPIAGIEGPDYVPHVTLARGGPADADALAGTDVEPVTWTVSALELYSATHREPVCTLALSG